MGKFRLRPFGYQEYWAAEGEYGLERLRRYKKRLDKRKHKGGCPRCHRNPKADPHTCPYAEDMHGDSVTLCRCCSDCRHECAMDI